MDNEFVTIKERNVQFDNQKKEFLEAQGYPKDQAIQESYIVGPTSFRIEHKDKRIPTMHFLTEEDMMAVYALLENNHMRFGS